MNNTQSATSLEQSPDDERRSRMIKYTVAMSIRMVCIVVGVLVQGPVMWIAFAGAILLPYFAVVLANSQGPSSKVNTSVIAPTRVVSSSSIKFAPSSEGPATASGQTRDAGN